MPKNYLPVMRRDDPPSLKPLFAAHGIRFGMAVSSAVLDNVAYYDILQRHCSVLTFESEMKMVVTQPQPIVWNFAGCNKIALFAQHNKMELHGHTVLWHSSNPRWLNEYLSVHTKAEGLALLKDRADVLCSNYNLSGMDSVNEAYCSIDGYIRSPWTIHLGAESLIYAMNAVSNAGTPSYYNCMMRYDANGEAEMESVLKLIEMGNCDGVGIQFHRYADDGFKAFRPKLVEFITKIVGYGKPVRFSEVGGITSKMWTEVVELALEFPGGVTELIQWGIKDPAWRGDVMLFDYKGKPKQAFWDVVKVLKQ